MDNLDPPTYVKTKSRVVALGDLHGDFDKTVQALMAASVMDVTEGMPFWVGANTTVVQVGDILDRGDDEIAILMLLRDLHLQAREFGGQLLCLNGNHESLNLSGEYRYVTAGAFRENATVTGLSIDQYTSVEQLIDARQMLYSPGGPVARDLALNSTILVVNDTVFAHGGLLPSHLDYGAERINEEVAAWMRGDADREGLPAQPPFPAMGNATSIMWNRDFGTERFNSQFQRKKACALLDEVLDRLQAKRLVIGHTPQVYRGLNSECDDRVWRIDVGMSAGVLDAQVEFLEILPTEEEGVSRCLIYVEDEGYVDKKAYTESGMQQLASMLGSWV